MQNFMEIFWKNWVFIWKEDIMKKGILNEVNEIRRMMGLVSEQNDSIMDMLSSAFDNMLNPKHTNINEGQINTRRPAKKFVRFKI